MKLYNKITSICLILSLLFVVSGCGGNSATANNKKGYSYKAYTGADYGNGEYYDYNSFSFDNKTTGGKKNSSGTNKGNKNNQSNNNKPNSGTKDNNSSSSGDNGGSNSNSSETIETIKWESGTLTAPGGEYNLPDVKQTSNGPVIAEATKQVNPGSSITVTGSGFSAANTKAYYYAKSGDQAGRVYEAQACIVDDTQMEVTIDSSVNCGAYGVYIKSSSGTSAIRMVNVAKIWWSDLTDVNAGDEFSVYGENLTDENKNSNVYLLNQKGNYYKMKVTFADPYKVTVQIPDGLSDGNEYTIRLHNGYGGENGWTESDEKIVFKKSKINEWTGKTIDVTSCGAKPSDASNDDSAAVQKAIDSADNWDTIYFPAGTYLFKSEITSDKILNFKGAGADKTKIVVGGNVSAEALININAGPTEFSGFGFEDVRTKQFANNMIQYKGDGYVSGSFNLYIHDCKFLQSTRPAARSWKAPITVRGAACAVIENNFFETTALCFSSSVSKLFVRNNEVCGVCYCGTYYNQNCLLIWNTDRIDASNNRFYGKDIITDPDGTLSLNDFTVGRTFALQQNNSNVYISHNKMERVGLPSDNAGEQIMFESISNLYLGSITGATSDTVTISGVTTTMLNKRSIVTVVDGKGVTQYRYVKSVKGKTITLNESWTIIPDTTSTVMISNCFDNIAVYDNYVDGYKSHNENYTATCGVQIYGNSHNMFIDSNTFKNMCAGVCVTSHYRCDDVATATNGVYWTQVDRNKISNTSQGIRFKLANMVTKKQEKITMYTSFGVTVRENEFRDMVDFEFASRKTLGGVGIEIGTRNFTYVTNPETITWNGEWEFGTLIEKNKFINSQKYNVLLCKHQGKTVLRGNEASGNISNVYDIEGVGYAPLLFN